MEIPNKRNFCGGNFQDWLEVYLTQRCNGTCSWCVDKEGYHPEDAVSPRAIVNKALETGKKNISLLGGEPTLYVYLRGVIRMLAEEGCHVYLTTNGSRLTPAFVEEKLKGLACVNISVHDYVLDANAKITGIELKHDILRHSIQRLHDQGTNVRFNCNCIAGHIDNWNMLGAYMDWAKDMGADNIRFAELKHDENNFVDLAEIFSHKYGLNNDPFTHGCTFDTDVFGIPVNFRQMCGLQTPLRRRPENPELCTKQVLYYDGKLYDGWQIQKKEEVQMDDEKLAKLMEDVQTGKCTPEEAAKKIKAMAKKQAREAVVEYETGAGCVY